MKLVNIMATVILLFASAAAARAQERQLLKAKVPFAFSAEDRALPAGTYTVSLLAPYNMIRVQSADGRKVAIIAAIPSQKLQQSTQVKLVFRHLGSEYFLVQVWEQGSFVHRDLQTGKRAVELSKTGEKGELVTVLADVTSGPRS